MKIKNAILSGLVTFLYVIVSILVSMVVEMMILSILGKILIVPYPVQTIIRILIYTVGGSALLGFLSYHEGYREAFCAPAEIVVGTVLAAIPHVLLSLLFHFQGFIAGGVRFTAGLIYYGKDVTHDLIAKVPVWLFLVIFLLYTVLYAAVMAICKYLGARRRVIDRAELTGE